MAKVIIFGNSDLASVAHVYLTHDSSHEVVAFTVDRAHQKEDSFRGLPVIAFEEIENTCPPGQYEMFIPISFKKMNHLRAAKFAEAKEKGYSCISYVSSKATTWPGFQCGENCFILEDNTIQPFVEIGDNVVMWSGNHIGHHSKIRDHVFITSHVVICGSCVIEPYCFLGVNATIRDETIVAPETLVGAGALILHDTQECEVYKAEGTSPAKIRSNQIRSISHKSNG